MSDDVCPVCSLPWPDFCPLDGSKLHGPGTCRNAPQADAAAPEPAAKPKPKPKPKPKGAAKRKAARTDTKPVGGTKRAATAAMGSGNLQRTAELSQIPGDEEVAPKPRAGARKAKRPTRKLKRRGTEPAASQVAAPAPAHEELADTEPAPSGDPAREAATARTVADTPAPVAAEVATPKQPKAKRRKRADEDLKKTVVEMSAVEAAPVRPAPRKRRGGAAKHLAPRPRTRSEDIAREAAEAQAAKAAKAPKAGRRGAKHRDSVFSRIAKAMRGDAKGKEQAPAPAKPGRRKRGFSETQWFLQGVKEDGDILEVKSSDEQYEYDESVSEEERRKFTLRREDEE